MRSLFHAGRDNWEPRIISRLQLALVIGHERLDRPEFERGHAVEAMERIRDILIAGNGTSWLRHAYAREHNLADVMQLQAELWMGK